MKKSYNIKIVIFTFLITLFSMNSFSQGASCADTEPFCAGGPSLTFQNSTGTTSETGIDYDCLGSQPNPAWFFMQIGLAGNINFQINQATNGGTPIDVDFIVWGPFPGPIDTSLPFPYCGPTFLNQTTEVDCSFSASATENFSLVNAQVGQIFVVLLTNYSGQAGNITVTQTNSGQAGAGATDCNIVCPLTLGPNPTVCPGDPVILTASIAGATSYQWSSSVTGPIPGNTQSITVFTAGTYTVVVNKPGCVANATASVTVMNPTPPNLATPINLQQCNNQPNFNLLPVIASLFNGTGLNPNDFEVYIHNTLADAQGVQNALGGLNNFPIGGTNPRTLYMSIIDNTANGGSCVYTSSFTIETVVCSATPVTPPNLILCDDASNDGSEIFDMSVQTPIVLGANSPANYTITYHLSQADADNDVAPIGNINAFPNTSNPQTIYVRMEEVANPLTYGTTSFQLIVNVHPVAGVDGSTTVCETSTTVIDLFSLITGEQPGGVWTQTSGTGGVFNAVAATYTPAVGATTSTFTYTVTGVAPCTTDTSLATVNINPQPTAGVDGSTTVCETSTATIDLYSLITGEQPGGVWTQTSGTGGVFNAVAATYTPAVGATTSTFTYTVTGVAPCTTDTSLATVNINPQPTAGVDGSTTVCETSTTVINLFSLITGEQPGGVWTQTSGTGGVFNAAAATYTPGVGATTSTFTYTVIGVAPCINDTSL
ncbi:MAG: hypothetical protein JNJ52_02845, partial [Flavobacterium sp.]|nr:hypothetical protein [Flavobacterium sp.]